MEYRTKSNIKRRERAFVFCSTSCLKNVLLEQLEETGDDRSEGLWVNCDPLLSMNQPKNPTLSSLIEAVSKKYEKNIKYVFIRRLL